MKKYELTGDVVVTASGVTLHRIRALVSFGPVTAGELGGYIEKPENLDQNGNAWISGNARVSGDALVHGNARVSGGAWNNSPLYIQGTRWSVTACEKKSLQIGCQVHTIEQWLARGENIARANGCESLIDEYRLYVELAARRYAPELLERESRGDAE